jgi:hypothetical protein
VTASEDLTTLERTEAITSLADAFTKQVKACASSAPKLSRLAVASEVMTMLYAFVTEKFPDAAPHLLAVLEPFGAELEKAYG